MNRRFLLLLLPVGVVLLAAMPRRDTIFWACAVDSITQGGVFAHTPLCERLRGAKADAGTAFGTANLGVGGETCTQIEARVERDVLNRGFTGVLLRCGANDCGASATASQVQARITSIGAKTRDAGLGFITLPISPFGGSAYDTSPHRDCVNDTNGWMADGGLAQAVPGALFVDTRSVIRDGDAGMSDYLDPVCFSNPNDYLHFNETCHQREADVVLDAGVLGR